MKEAQIPESTPTEKNLRKIGCYGCLLYIFLFAVSGGVITALGFNTLWVIPFLAVYIIIWALLFFFNMREKGNKF